VCMSTWKVKADAKLYANAINLTLIIILSLLSVGCGNASSDVETIITETKSLQESTQEESSQSGGTESETTSSESSEADDSEEVVSEVSGNIGFDISVDGKSDVVTSQVITINLNDLNIDASTITASNVSLSRNNVLIPSSIQFDTAANIIRLTPNTYLIPGQQYTVTIGGLTSIQGDVIDGSTANFSVVEPVNRLVMGGLSGRIIIYDVGQDGLLTENSNSQTSLSTGGAINRMALDNGGENFYVAETIINTGMSSLLGFSIDSNNALVETIGSPFASIVGFIDLFHKENTPYFYVVNNTANHISTYKQTLNSPELTLVSGSQLITTEIKSPRILAFHPSQNLAYILFAQYEGDPDGNSVKGYRVNNSTGVLSELSGVTVTHALGSRGMQITPDGKFLYVINNDWTNYTLNELRYYEINATTGVLSEGIGSPITVSYDSLSDIIISPNGKNLFALVHRLAENRRYLIPYEVNKLDGALTPIPEIELTGVGGGRISGSLAMDKDSEYIYIKEESEISNNTKLFVLNIQGDIIQTITIPEENFGALYYYGYSPL
jgi:hypothetical protein